MAKKNGKRETGGRGKRGEEGRYNKSTPASFIPSSERIDQWYNHWYHFPNLASSNPAVVSKDELVPMINHKTKHKSKGGGLHVGVHLNSSGRWSTFLIQPSKLQHGKRLTGCCVHHVGGSQKATLTTKRRKQILRTHKLKRQGSAARCTEHVKMWKRKCVNGAV